MPTSWDMMIRAERVNWRQYTLTASLDPENRVKENKRIPIFVFEYFLAKRPLFTLIGKVFCLNDQFSLDL